MLPSTPFVNRCPEGQVYRRGGVPQPSFRPGPADRLAPVRRLFVIAVALLLPLLVVACGSAEVRSTAPDTVEGTVPEEGAETGETETGETETGETQPEETETGEEGAEGEADPEAGAEVFASAGCGSCHVLEEAGSTGTVGPTLDGANLEYEAAYQQIAQGGGGMPPFEGQLDEQQLADVTAFVVEASRG